MLPACELSIGTSPSGRATDLDRLEHRADRRLRADARFGEERDRALLGVGTGLAPGMQRRPNARAGSKICDGRPESGIPLVRPDEPRVLHVEAVVRRSSAIACGCIEKTMFSAELGLDALADLRDTRSSSCRSSGR